MNRRKMLALLGGSMTAAAAGCLGDDDDDEEEADDPEETDDDVTDEEEDDTEDEEEELDPAEFEVTITGTSSPVKAGETLDVDYEVTNVGEQTADASVQLDIAGIGDVGGGTITNVDGGSTRSSTVEWITNEADEGEYEATLSIGDSTDSITVVVEPLIEPAETISVVSNAFEPAIVSVDEGETVLWSGEEGNHTVTFYHEENDREHRVPDGVDLLDEGLGAGEETHFEFTTAGVYNYYCQPHEGAGMVGIVVVGENDDPDQPGLSPIGEDIPEGAALELQALTNQAREILGIPTGAQEFDVTAEMASFDPPVVDMAPGDTIRWTAAEGDHTVTFYHEDVEIIVEEAEEPDEEPVTESRQHRVPDDAESFDVELEDGAEAEFTPQVEGVYDYFCRPHEGEAMVGTFVVGENDDQDQPGLQEPDETIPSAAADALRELNVDGHELSGIPVLSRVVENANDAIESLNYDEEFSLSVINEGLENVDDVRLIGYEEGDGENGENGVEYVPVTAETQDEAEAEATRLRDEAVRVNDDVFTQVPQEVNEQAGFPYLDVDDINNPQEAREQADDVIDQLGDGELPQQIAEGLRGAADIVEEIDDQLQLFADRLEAAIILA